jgi:hypothetical protein
MARYRDMNITSHVGLTAFEGFTLETWGDKGQYHTRVTCNSAFPDIPGGANLAVGKKAFDFPAGEIIVERSSMALALKYTDVAVTADTPDLGIGTTIGSGVVAVLGGTAAFENIITGQTMNDCNGTVERVTVDTPLVIATADSHSVFVNVADGWAADGDPGLLLNGTFDIFWQKVS